MAIQALDFRLDERSAVPVYEQLREQVVAAVARGALRRGERLPAVRSVALALGVNPNTVNRAYRELEREEVIVTRRGRGTFVADAVRRDARAQRTRLVRVVERFVSQVRALGFEDAQIAGAVEAQLKRRLRSPERGGG